MHRNGVATMHKHEATGAAVIVGGGHAGGELCFALREQGWQGAIVLVSDEPCLPYHRPPLSKTFLVGDARPDTLQLRPHSAYEKAQIRWIGGAKVSEIRRASKVVVLSDGRELPYAKLALATGGSPRRLPQGKTPTGGEPTNLHYLRTVEDGLRLGAQFRPGARLVVIGGGYIGLEVAALAIGHGLQVVVLEAATRLLARVTSPEMSAFYERAHQQAGVEVRTGVQVTGFDFDAQQTTITAVRCGDATRRMADLVVAGIGLHPNTELASAAGLAVNDGIVVDELARTSDLDIVAAGDCTRHPCDIAGGRLVRLESVPNAAEQARTAAATMCGRERPHRALPWFWSDQYDLKLRSVGLMQGYDTLVVRGSMEERSFSVFYLEGRRVVAADSVNRMQEFMVVKRLVGDRLDVNPAQLADTAMPLKDLVVNAQREGERAYAHSDIH
jgi:3-phenylpropionate/trans-cinnamate dioxygenase ferredoxin reductase subunit